jgi:hypothetical protein
MMNQIQLPNNNRTQPKVVQRTTREHSRERDEIVVSDDHTPINTPPNVFFRTLKKRMDGYYATGEDKDIAFKSKQ